MEILQLHKSHLEDVVSLWNSAVEKQGEDYQNYKLSVERLASIMEDANFLPEGALVAHSDGKPVGFALGYVQTVDSQNEGNLESKPGRLAGLAVHPDYWRRGIGRALLEAVEAALKKAGKSGIAMETYARSVYLVNRVFVDSGPYRFLLACGYRPLTHELGLYNDLSRFQLGEDIKERQSKLEAEGFTFRWYEPTDRDNLLQFMAQYFSGGWHTFIQSITGQEPLAKILLALASDRIVGFIGGFHVDESGQHGKPREYASFGSPGVDPDFRQRGIGTVLFHLGLDYLKNEGASYVPYDTDVTNPARFMYFRSGAQFIRVSCCYFYKQL